MSRQGGTDDEILTLPCGGGGVSGAGIGVDVDLNTGTASSAVPLELPPGPNGVRPELTITYHSGAGDGLLGIGWTMGLPMVTRQRQGDRTVYALGNVGTLRQTSPGSWRPEVDTLGHGIHHQGDGSGWEMVDRRDTVHALGSTPASRVVGPDGLPVLWVLDRVTDAFGNSVSYDWRQEGGQMYLERIAWGTWHLTLEYEVRPDRLLDGHLGILIETARRCSRLSLGSSIAEPPLVKSWELTYDNRGGQGRSLLTAVSVVGHGPGGEQTAAPPIRFTYTSRGPPRLTSLKGWNPGSLRSPSFDFVDLTGDGLPDAIDLGAGIASVWRNRGRGRWRGPYRLDALPTPLRLGTDRVSFADMNGDGAADLLQVAQPMPGFYPFNTRPWTRPDEDATAEGLFDRPVLWRQAPTASIASPRVRLLDLDADARTDLLVDSGRAWMRWTQAEGAGWNERPDILPSSRTPPVRLDDARVFLADLSGDGDQDVVQLRGNTLRFWPSLGPEGWAAERRIAVDGMPPSLDPRRIRWVDLDGDGCADLVYVGSSQVLLWWNVGADRLDGPHDIQGTPVSSPNGCRILDLNGSGTMGLLYDLAVPGARRGQCYLEPTGGRKASLLASIDHGTGARTDITYRSSTEFAIDDKADGRPWTTFHPFPVQCVASVQHSDATVPIMRRVDYKYRDGRFDPRARTFVGFGHVTSESAGDRSAPALRNESDFHVGLDPDDPHRALTPEERVRFGALRRRPLIVTVRGIEPDGTPQPPITVTRYTYTTSVVTALDGSLVVLPYTTGTVEERHDSQPAIVSTHRIDFLDVDANGDVHRQRSVAAAADGTVARDVTMFTSMATGGRNLSLPARCEQRDRNGRLLAASIQFYDGTDHVGLPEGQATIGALRRTEDMVLADDVVQAAWGGSPPDMAAFGYHRLPGESGWWVTRASRAESVESGVRVLATRGPMGAQTILRMDTTGQFVANVTDAMGNTTMAAHDPRSGQVNALTDENGVTRKDLFDTLGRVVGTLLPGDSESAPSQSWHYETAALPLRIDAMQRGAVTASAATASITYLDGEGRVLCRLKPAGRIDGLPPGHPAWVVTQANSRNARGLVARSWLPYLATVDSYAAPPGELPHVRLFYNAAGQLLREERPDGESVSYERTGSSVVISSQRGGGTPLPRERHNLDACGQTIRVSRFDGTRWVGQDHEWDDRGRLVRTTTADGAVSTLTYDMLGRPVLVVAPETGRTGRLFDAAGCEVVRRNAAGQEYRQTFDPLRRPLTVSWSGSAGPDVRYAYLDTGMPSPPDGTRFRVGRLWQVHDEVGTLTLAYDQMGRTVERARSEGLRPGSFVTELRYDGLGRVASMVLPDLGDGAPRTQVDYTFDEAGRPLSASDAVTDVRYDIYGRIVQISYGNGTITRNAFDQTTGRLLRQQVFASDGGLLLDQGAGYDEKGQLETLDEVAGQTRFTYDGLQRLTAVAAPGRPAEAYDYSDGGNMTSGASGAMAYAPNSGLLVSAGGLSYVHDAAGRLQQAPYGTLAFDAADHLISVDLSSGGRMTHSYDHLDRHAATSRDGTLQYAALTDELEFRDGQLTLWVSFGGRRLLVVRGNQRRWLHPDVRGNVTLVTDAAGAAFFRASFSAYGLPAAPGPAAPDGVGFLGGAPDESGLMCVGLRWYDPRLGRFVSPDPIIAGIFVIDAWNPYVYGHNNPVLFVDPTGAWSFWGVLAVSILVAVIVVAAVFTGGAALAGLGVLSTLVTTDTLVAVGIGAFGGAMAGGLSALKAGGSVWGGAILGGIIGGATALAGGAIGSAVMGSLGRTYAGFVVSGALQGAVGGFSTGFVVGFAGGKGTLNEALLSATRGAIWGAFFGGVLGFGSRYLFVGDGNEHNYFEFGTFNRYLNQKPGDIKSALDVGDNVTGTVEDGVFTGSHITGKGLNGGDVGDIIDFTSIRDIGQKGYDAINHQTFAFFSDGSIVMVNLNDVASAMANGGIGLAATGSVMLDANGYSYAAQFALLLKNIPLLGNFLALSDERNLGWYEDSSKGFNAFWGSRSGGG